MKKKISLLIFFGILFFNVQSQMIKEIPFEKENSVFKLTYDLPEIASSYEVILTSNYPTGRGFIKVTENALGDVGENISSGKNKTIYWQPKKGEDFNEAILEFKIVMIPLASANNRNDNGEEPTVIEIPANVVAKRKAVEDAKKKAALEKSKAEAAKKKILESKPGTSGGVGDPNPNSSGRETNNAMSGAGAEIKGRTVRSKPNVPMNNGVNGVVIVQVCINTKGEVEKAKFIQNGSTITEEKTIGEAVTNSKLWLFNENSMAADRECGTIKFYYKVK